LAEETSGIRVFGMITQPAKVLMHFVALKWCKNVTSETGLGRYEEACVMLEKTL